LDSPILQFIFICGVLYGLITLFVAIKQKPNKSKNQIGLSIALVVVCGTAFLTAITSLYRKRAPFLNKILHLFSIRAIFFSKEVSKKWY